MGTFFERLREERRRIGLNQTEFAELGGVKKGAQLNYESGERSPDANYLLAIAAAGVDINYLITGVISDNTITEDESELIEGYRALDVRGKAGVLNMISVLNPGAGTVQATFHGNVGQTVQGDLVVEKGDSVTVVQVKQSRRGKGKTT